MFQYIKVIKYLILLKIFELLKIYLSNYSETTKSVLTHKFDI